MKGGKSQRPRLEGTHRISLNDHQSFTVWTAICPHEGGPLELGKVCNGTIVCSWHNLRQSGVELHAGGPPQELFGDLQLALDGDELIVRQK